MKKETCLLPLEERIRVTGSEDPYVWTFPAVSHCPVFQLIKLTEKFLFSPDYIGDF